MYTPDSGWCHGIDPGIVQILGRMPQAHLKEGSDMRVESILAINTHQQHNPRTTEYAGASTGKTSSGTAFEDYLRANLQQVSTPVVTRQTENQLAGLLMGYITQLKVTPREDPKTEINAS